MNKPNVRVWAGLLVAIPLFLLFQNCADNYRIDSSGPPTAASEAVPSGPSVPTATATPLPDGPATCVDLDHLADPLKVIFIGDEPGQAALVSDFVGHYAARANFSWSLIQANAISARSAPAAFVSADAMSLQLNDFAQSAVSTQQISLTSAVTAAAGAISSDSDYLSGALAANYMVILISSGGTGDFGSATQLQALNTAAAALVGLRPGHISFGAVFLPNPSITAAGSLIAEDLKAVATAANGQFATIDISQPTGLTFAPVANAPAALCNALPLSGPDACTVGATQNLVSPNFTQSAACGLNGSKQMVFRTHTTEVCEQVSAGNQWTITSISTELVSEGACSGQACRLPDGSLLVDGQSRTIYSTATPSGACSTVSQIRVCQNGTLSGSPTYSTLACTDGCGAFGINGTTKTNVVTGQLTIPVTCQFGETGVTSTYDQLSDQACNAGQVVSTNVHQGNLETAGQCPTYKWIATANYGVCSANCGGTQQKIYQCLDNKGASADAARCSGAIPVDTQVCDGNPTAAAYTDSTTSTETSGLTYNCPANQVGVTVSERTDTTNKSYACVNHSLQLANTQVVNGAWISENYCLDYVAHRCSQDSLSNTQAQARYNWMLNCRASDPMIDQFLNEFNSVKVSGYTIGQGPRYLYPTFMKVANGNETPWIAPVLATASCSIPATAYVAAVCISSCATPEQEILAQAERNLKMRNVSFIDALIRNNKFVATMSPHSSIDATAVATTRVDQWVTELIDTDHAIREFHLASGKSLRVTPNHPLLSPDGSMKLASDFVAGESLVSLGGSLDAISSINDTIYNGKVYNLLVKSADLQKNVVITNGFLNGTAFFQNEGAQYINRALFRNKLSNGVFEK